MLIGLLDGVMATRNVFPSRGRCILKFTTGKGLKRMASSRSLFASRGLNEKRLSCGTGISSVIFLGEEREKTVALGLIIGSGILA